MFKSVKKSSALLFMKNKECINNSSVQFLRDNRALSNVPPVKMNLKHLHSAANFRMVQFAHHAMSTRVFWIAHVVFMLKVSYFELLIFHTTSIKLSVEEAI